MSEGPPRAAGEVTAAALQRVLLPPGLPDVAGWAMAALYAPAGEEVLVGGDFYDWFTLPSGRVLVLVGDVSGKGPLAGALGMSIRKALKGAAWATGEVAGSLPLLEQALAEEFGDAFATLCLLELEPGSGTVRLVLAGHPAPWVRTQGVLREVEAPANGLLGPRLQPSWEPTELHLAAGDALVLFTDGLVEAPVPSGQRYGEGEWQRYAADLSPDLGAVPLLMAVEAGLRTATTGLADDVIVAVLVRT